ncbi:3-methyladenine DNA glycosylase [Legionella quinlivanii]|uniref:Putative 3-methyladenine DNA glycosylase n=1 Tax=Legionella quinlivanii TaxID=45073 RepID=A0A364LGW3_9GAMM|nr:DNA-3-methyladenine glycosylase [Legionella quinlivanii]RAP35443.1 3-methyladenine DNA glycosylase [Legionella quinlivanii]
MKKIEREFYARDTTIVAQDLLGKYLVRHIGNEQKIGRIVEVEAYLGQHDLAAHSSKGLTPRTRVMFGPAGHAYVYLIYGMYYCTNIVTEREGKGCGVLLRALEPIKNISERTQGPGLLSKAMGITKEHYGQDLLSDHFYLLQDEPGQTPFSIVKTPRIGVHYAKEWATELLRFYIKDNPFVSRK